MAKKLMTTALQATSCLGLISVPTHATAQPSLNPQIQNVREQLTDFVRKVTFANPDGLQLEYQLPGEQNWRRFQDGSVIQVRAVGAIKVRTVARQNFIHSLQGAVTPGIYAPREWSFAVAGPLAQMIRTRTVCVNQNDCHTAQLPSPDPRAETQIETVGYDAPEQLRIKVNQIGIARFDDWLGTGFAATKPEFCTPLPYPGANDQGLSGTNQFLPDWRAQFEAARSGNWQDMSTFAVSLATWCMVGSRLGKKPVSQALTYAEFVNLVARRGPEIVGQLPAPDQTPYWTVPAIATAPQLQANKAAYTYAANGSLIDSQTLYADNSAAKVMVSNGAAPYGVTVGRGLITQFGNTSGVQVLWPLEKRPEAFKRIALFEIARIQQSLDGLTLKLSRQAGRTFRVRFGYSGQPPMIDKTAEAAGLVYPIASMTEGTFVFESRLYFKGDRASASVVPFVPTTDNEVLIQLTAKLPAKIDIEVENPGPNVDVDLKAGQVSVLAKLRFENGVDQQGTPTMRVSLRPACQQIRNPDGTGYSNCAIDLGGFQVTSDGGLLDNAATWYAEVENTVRSLIAAEVTNAIANNLGRIDQGVLDLSSILGAGRVTSCGSGAACFSLQALVPLGGQPISIGPVNTTPSKITEALIGYPLQRFPVRFVKTTACQARCAEVVALKVDPKVTFATNGLFDSVIPYATAY